jgi:hypothetical protein
LLLISLAGLALSAQSARAQTRVISGGESRLRVNIISFTKLAGAGLWVYEIPPARIVYGRQPAAIFPIRNVGVIDPGPPLGTVSHDGGLSMRKQSIGVTLDITNITATCAPVTGCRVLGTANAALPNEVAELHDVTITDDGSGTVTLQGNAKVGAVSALALNTLFQTTVFTPGFDLGLWTSQIQYVEPASYPRPATAGRVQVDLVPAYRACETPNRQHGPPLVGGSCNPPVMESSEVTVGTESASYVTVAARAGNQSTSEDEADARVTVNALDVRDATTREDHTGQLTARVSLRITDRASGLLPGGGSPGTVSDLPLDVPVACAATAEEVGATCSVSTTVDTLLPGAVAEGSRSVWELGQVQVLDSTETPFLRQGVFVP